MDRIARSAQRLVGLLLVCAVVLTHAHDQAHPHAHEHGHHHEDLNLRAAYLHVLADAFTSVTAISALLAGKFFAWTWLDPAVGILGSGVVLSWAYSLISVFRSA